MIIILISALTLLFVLWAALVARWQSDLRRLQRSEADFRALTTWCRQLEDKTSDALSRLEADLSTDEDRRELASWQAWVEAGRKYRLEKIGSPVYPREYE